MVTLADGVRKRISGTPAINTKAAALAAERAHIERTLRPELDQAGKEVPTLRAFVPEFMETYVRANNKPSERMSKEYLFKFHLLPAFGRKRLDEISTRDVEKLKAEKLKTLAPKTVNNMLSCLGKTLRYAAECEVIDRIPRIRFVRTMELAFDFLEFEEYGRLIVAASEDAETYPAILLAGDAGLRVGEIRALEWGDLDLVAGRVMVQRTDYRGYVGSPKGGRMRRVPMTERLRAALKAARHLKAPYVFCNSELKHWSRGEADTPLRRARTKAGLRKFGWHTLRHHAESWIMLRRRKVPMDEGLRTRMEGRLSA